MSCDLLDRLRIGPDADGQAHGSSTEVMERDARDRLENRKMRRDTDSAAGSAPTSRKHYPTCRGQVGPGQEAISIYRQLNRLDPLLAVNDLSDALEGARAAMAERAVQQQETASTVGQLREQPRQRRLREIIP